MLDERSEKCTDSLDALVAAAAYHTLLMENDRVRVIETLIPPGEIVPLHTHGWPGVLHILSWSDFIRRDEKGAVKLDTRQLQPPSPLPAVAWSEPLPPHTVENVGQSTIRIIAIELKDLEARSEAIGSDRGSGSETVNRRLVRHLQDQADPQDGC
jgi:hypothetical protein